MLKRGTLLLLWGLTLLWSFHSGRLDLLLRGVFHGLVGMTGLLLLMLGMSLLLKREERMLALALAAQWRDGRAGAGPPPALLQRSGQQPPPGPARSTGIGLCSPPEQRSLNEWVRCCAASSIPTCGRQSSPHQRFCLEVFGPPLIARFTVRCCLADATPAGLAWSGRSHSRPKPTSGWPSTER